MPEQSANRETVFRPLDVVLIVQSIICLAGAGLLLSSPETTNLMEGAKPWHTDSPLRAVVQLLCLNYAFPTISPGAVKMYVLGLCAGLVLVSIGVALLAGARGSSSTSRAGAQVASATEQTGDVKRLNQNDDNGEEQTHVRAKRRDVSPLIAAQALIGLYLLWSFASARWSSAPELAVGGSILLTIQFFWAFGLAFGLTERSATLVTQAIVAITGVIGVLAIWYFFGRNPGLRAMFPFGNPIFLATCLISGLLLSLSWLIHVALHNRARLDGRVLALILAIVVAHGAAAGAFFLADSRGPALGLLFGLFAMAFFLLRGKWKLAPLVSALIVLVALGLFFEQTKDDFSPSGRSATIRQREYAWDYAWRMFLERPFTGQGQGAFVLKGDSYAVDDVLADPQVFENRISHVHNEWLEVLADLGAVGVVLLLGGLLITLRAAMQVIDSAHQSQRRWVLAGVASALVGVLVTETFSVGLRVSGVPTFFFTLLGLCWCLSRTQSDSVVRRLSTTRSRGVMYGTVASGGGLAVLFVAHADWSAARAEYNTGVAFAQGHIDEAIALAQRSIVRLSPQRALRSLSRLAETHAREAITLQQKALDRERRAFATEPANTRLIILARDDFDRSEHHCIAATHALKELVSRSPGFIGSGMLEYQISMTRATNADARARLTNEPGGAPLSNEDASALVEARNQFARNAIRSLEREMRRQPYSTVVAVEFARAAAGSVEFSVILDVLARPLRQSRITPDYVDVMGYLLSDPENDRALYVLTHEAKHAITVAAPLDKNGNPVEIWAPERLRLDGMVRFLRGDFVGSAESLEVAHSAYRAIGDYAALATASCVGELADAVFYVNPLETKRAVTLAQAAIERAPGGRVGKELASGVKRRLVDYKLAGGLEPQAMQELASAAPPGTNKQDVLAELALRYRRLCESMLSRRPDMPRANPPGMEVFAGPPAPEPDSYYAPALVAAMTRWIERAIELESEDPDMRRIAAAIALERSDPADAVKQIRAGIENGLSNDVVGAFIEAASARYPTDESLRAFALEQSGDTTASAPS